MQVAHMTSATRSFCSYMRSWCSETTSENSNFFLIKQISWGENVVLQRTHKKMLFSNELTKFIKSSVVKKDGSILATRCIEFTCTNMYLRGQIWGGSMHKEHTPVFCRWPYPCQRGCCHILETITTYNCPNAKPSSIKRSTTKNGTSKLIEKRIFQKQEALICKHEKRF